MMLDDWRAGIDTYLFEPHAVRDHLARAQPILAQHFSIEAISRQWHEVLGGGRAELAASEAYWQPAAQMARTVS
jgi:hypothetical protein